MMNPLPSCLDLIFGRMLQASWQTAVLAALVLVAQLIFRNKLSPAWRYGLWLLLVVRLLMPLSPPSAFSVFNLGHSLTIRPAADPSTLPPVPVVESTAPAPPDPVPLVAGQGLQPQPLLQVSARGRGVLPHAPGAALSRLHSGIEWLHIAAVVWLVGVFVLGLRLAAANFFFRRRLARHAPVADERIGVLVRDCARALGVTQAVMVMETEAVGSPAVCGFRRKWLLLPDGIFERFSEDELRHVFLHEFAHLKRRDLEVNWLVTILQILHWFNPVLWLAFTRMRADRELATDALALAHARESEHVPYGETILKVLEGFTRASAQPGLVGIAESKARLKERLREIARGGSARPWRWTAVGLAAVITGIGLTDAQQPKTDHHANRSATASNPKNARQRAATTPGRARAEQRAFAIRVMDFDTGAPLAGVKVAYTLKYYSGVSRTIEALSDKDGRATVELATGLKSLEYRAEKPNYLALAGEWLDQELSVLGEEYPIKLSAGVEIGGTITDETGKPVAGAEITFDKPIKMLLSASYAPWIDHAETWTVPSGKHVATTDANGNWRAKCIWPAIQWASLRVHHPDFADVTCSTELTSAMEMEGKGVKVSFDDLKQRRVRLTLAKGTKLTGRVSNEAGEPLPGIQVNWAELEVSPNASDQLLGQRTVTTDAAGKFAIEHVPAKRLFFWVQAPDYAPAVVEGDPGSASEIEVHLTKGVALEGEVLDAQEGAPVAGARLRFADFSIWRGIRWSAVSDEQGRFVWSHAPTERFQLQVEKDGYISQGKLVQARANEKLSIRLNRTLRITGNVLDAETRKPITNFQVDWLDRGDPNDFQHAYHVVTVAGSNGVYSLDLGHLYAHTWAGGYAHQCLLRIRADGYAPVISRVFSSRNNDVGNVSYDLELKPVSQISGTVLGPQGQPVAGAQVALNLPGSRLLLSGKPSLTSTVAGSFQTTDAQGQFRLNTDPAAKGLIAMATAGYGEIKTNEFAANLTVKLQPWGRLEGTVFEYGNLLTNQQVWAGSANASWPESLRIQFMTNSDIHGQFAFDFVPPGKFRVYRMIPMGDGASSGPAKVVEVRPGTTATIKLGGEGRPVIGRFKITNPYVPIDWQKTQYQPRADSIVPRPPQNGTREDFEKWRDRPEIRQAFENLRNYPVQVAADGSFRIDEVVPGKYEMRLQIVDPRDPSAFAYSKFIVDTTKPFEVSAPAGGQEDSAPLDIGTLEISLKPDFKLGQTAAPEFEATGMDGHKIKLSDFHGKYVLLDFWATWCGPCIGEIPYLKQVQEKFKSRPDFVLVSLSVDKSVEDVRAFLKKNDLPWTQGHLGEWSTSSVPGAYGVQGIPAVFLINPEGKVIESQLEGSSLIAKLEKHLK